MEKTTEKEVNMNITLVELETFFQQAALFESQPPLHVVTWNRK